MPLNTASIIEENKYLRWDFCKEKATCKTKHACLPVQINSAPAPTADLSRHETHCTANKCQTTQTNLSLHRKSLKHYVNTWLRQLSIKKPGNRGEKKQLRPSCIAHAVRRHGWGESRWAVLRYQGPTRPGTSRASPSTGTLPPLHHSHSRAR